MFQLIEEVWIQNAAQLGERTVFFARGSTCIKITSLSSIIIEELETDHEEADTKIAYLIKHAAQNNNVPTVCVVRSSSGDIDIPIILLGMDEMNDVHIFIDSGSGKNRKLLDLGLCGLTIQQKRALLGMHAFTGNDYVSSFLRRGKQMCWNHVKADPQHLELFGNLGEEIQASEEVLLSLEKFVCKMYGEKSMTDVNTTRSKIFWKKLKKDDKVVDLSLLPPCCSSLRRHSLRANFVARMWRKAQDPLMCLEDPQQHGWLHDLTPDWIDVHYPEDVAELLVDSDDMNNSIFEADEYSSSSDTSDIED